VPCLIPFRIAVFGVFFLFASTTCAVSLSGDVVQSQNGVALAAPLADQPEGVQPCAPVTGDSDISSSGVAGLAPAASDAHPFLPGAMTSSGGDNSSRDCFAAATYPVAALADGISDTKNSTMLETRQIHNLSGFLALGFLIFLVRFRMLAGSRRRLL
jgi:hypothetical protein